MKKLALFQFNESHFANLVNVCTKFGCKSEDNLYFNYFNSQKAHPFMILNFSYRTWKCVKCDPQVRMKN